MAKDPCFDRVRKAASDAFTDSDLRDLIKRFREEEKAAILSGDNIKESLSNVGNDISNQLETQAKAKKFRHIRNVELLSQATSQLSIFRDRKDGFREALKSFLSGTQTGLKTSRRSVDLNVATRQNQLLSDLGKKVEDAKLTHYFNSREYETQLATVLGGGKTEIEGINKLGEIINSTLDDLDKRLKSLGIFIPKLDFRITRNYHDKMQMMKPADDIISSVGKRRSASGDKKILFDDAFNRWSDFIYKNSTETLLDTEKTFGGIRDDKERIKFLKEAFNTIVNGGNAAINEPSIVNRFTQKRVLHWKDPASVVKYNKKYGRKTIQDAVLADIVSSSRTIGLMERMGDNPSRFLDKLMDNLESDPNFKFTKGRGKTRAQMHRMLSEIDGSVYAPGTEFTNVLSNIRNILNVKVALTVLSKSLTDIGIVTGEVDRFNHNLFDSTIKAFKGTIKNLPKMVSEDKKQFLDDWNVNVNSNIGGVSRWYNTEDMPNGLMTRMMRTAEKVGLIHHWDYANRATVASQVAKTMADHRHIAFESLDQESKDIFGWYDIKDDEWDLIRKFPVKEIDGINYIVPQSIESIPDADVKKMLNGRGIRKVRKQRIKQTKDDIIQKLHTMVQDRMDHAILRPDSADRAFLRFGTKGGTISFEVAKMFAHFKSYMLAFTTKPLANAIYGKGAESIWEAFVHGKADRRRLIQLIAYNTILGYGSMSLWSILNNRTPPDPTKAITWAESLIEGSGPIYADLLLGHYRNKGANILGRIAGPDINNMLDLAAITQSFVRGEGSAKQAVHLIERNIPTPIYFKLALDALIFEQLDEWASPGSFRRKQRRLHEQGQDFIIPPIR